MNFFRNIFGSKFKIEKVQSENNCEVSFCPSRGGIVTSLVIKGREILYLDQDIFNDKDQTVRGGIPVLFPNAGAIPTEGNYEKFINLKRHGFARLSNSWQFTKNKGGFLEVLRDDTYSKEIYPYSFRLSVSGDWQIDNSLILKQEIENTDPNKEMPIAMGLHPYFKVADADKKDIIFNFQGGEIIKENFSIWSQGGTVYIDNPKCSDEKALLKLFIPGLGNLSLDVSEEYKKIWIWSEPGKDFICIEPMQRGLGGIVDDPAIIKPRQKLSLSMKISLI